MSTATDQTVVHPGAPSIIEPDVYFDSEKRLLVTTCSKCNQPVYFALGPITKAETAKAAILKFVEGYTGGPCPPRGGAIAPDAHFELGYYGYWQIARVLELIEQLQRQGILANRQAESLPVPSQGETMPFAQYVDEQRQANQGKKIPAEINQRWESRIIAEQHHTRGEAGATVYLATYGKNIAAPKLINLARKAETEGYPELARGFWKAAYRTATGQEPDGDPGAPAAALPEVTVVTTSVKGSLYQVEGLPDHLQPGKIVTMQPVDARHDRAFYIASDAYWGQPKRNGHRKVVVATATHVYYQSRQLNVEPAYAAEIDRAFAAVAADLGAFVVDGEAYYLDVSGKEHRTASEAAQANQRLGRPGALPAPRYAVFKALFAFRSDYTSEEESTRVEMGQALATRLRAVAPDSIEFLTPARTAEEKAALAARQRAEGREGEIWVRHDCQYQGGKNEKAQWIVRTKYLQQLAVIVSALTATTAADRPFGAIEVGVMERGQLRSLGQVGTGYTLKEMREIVRRFEAGQLTIRVATQGFTERGQLWHARFLGFADVVPAECTLDRATDYDDESGAPIAATAPVTVSPAPSTLEQMPLF